MFNHKTFFLFFVSAMLLLSAFIYTVQTNIAYAQNTSTPNTNDLVILDYHLLSKTRVGRTTFEFIFTADITNTGATDFSDVSADLSSLVATTNIVDNSLAFGLVTAGSTVRSTDTFAVRVDRRFPFNKEDLIVSVTAEQPPVENSITLLGRAIIPADTFIDGPTSGQHIGAGPFSGRIPPFENRQPVQGISAIVSQSDGSFIAMSDNGFGTKDNSPDYLLTLYKINPDFEHGTVDIKSFIRLSDPNRLINFPIQNENSNERYLTGADFDIESFQVAPDGTFWIGDEFGPFLLHTDNQGVVLRAPIPLPDVKSPQNPLLAGEANLPRSGGFEGMALSMDGSTLYPMLEKALAGDPQERRIIYEFDLQAEKFTGKKWYFRMQAAAHAIGELTAINEQEFLVIERDSKQGEAASFKKLFKININVTDSDAYVGKEEVANLLTIADPKLISLTGKEGDIGLGETFSFPFVTIEAVAIIDAYTLIITNDNNYPFSKGRNPQQSDATEIIKLQLTKPLAVNEFRVEPYLQNPTEDGILITWFTENNSPGTLSLTGGDLTGTKEYTSTPTLMPQLAYSALEESERTAFPDMFANANYKHSIQITELTAGTAYNYSVNQGNYTINNTFNTAPEPDSLQAIRFIVYADSETEPAGRHDKRDWGNREVAPAAQAEGSTGRPDNLAKDSRGRELYLATQFEGFAENIKVAKLRKPDFIIMPGDLVQGGGYQRAWDEFFFHNAGKFDDLLSTRPILPALGNWENFAARNGGYAPEAVMASRAKYKAYFDQPANNNPDHQDLYYRIDYGPITIITLDSSNGLPQNSDADTNVNIDESTYPGNDLPDFNPGSDQWHWAMAQLEDAKTKGQLIFVQFHHAAYTSGRHGYPVSSTNPRATGQAGIPMRVYSPMFEQYGVVAVFSGHSEFFERSLVNGVHYYDTGTAGDGLRGPEEPQYAAVNNPYSQWTAHYNEAELWDGNRLISGGKHYGHLEVNVVPHDDNGSFGITMTPVHVFPIIDDNFNIIDWQRRVYNDEIHINIPKPE